MGVKSPIIVYMSMFVHAFKRRCTNVEKFRIRINFMLLLENLHEYARDCGLARARAHQPIKYAILHFILVFNAHAIQITN